MATEENVHFLQKDEVWIKGVRFLGCTLRTNVSRQDWSQMTDSRWLSYREALRIHQDHVSWLEEQLAPDKEPAVVITHHLPTRRLCHEKFDHSTAYVSDLNRLLTRNVRGWICGHSHETVVTTAASGCALILNPLGYPGEKRLSPPRTTSFRLPPYLAYQVL